MAGAGDQLRWIDFCRDLVNACLNVRMSMYTSLFECSAV